MQVFFIKLTIQYGKLGMEIMYRYWYMRVEVRENVIVEIEEKTGQKSLLLVCCFMLTVMLFKT